MGCRHLCPLEPLYTGVDLNRAKGAAGALAAAGPDFCYSVPEPGDFSPLGEIVRRTIDVSGKWTTSFPFGGQSTI